jgi:O-antigen ligase
VGFEVAALILVVLTSSRTGLISLFLGVAVCLFLHRKYLFGVGVSLLAAASGVIPLVLDKILSKFPASTGLRNYVVEEALTVWQGSPILGTGLGTVYYPAGDLQYDTMNTYVNMLLRYGVLGLAFYLLFFVVLMIPDVRAWFRTKIPDRDLILRTGCVAAFLVMIYSLDTFGIVLMWSLPGLFTAMRTLQLSQETEPQT